MLKRNLAVLLWCLTIAACVPIRPTPPPQPPTPPLPPPQRVVVVTVRGNGAIQTTAGRLWDDFGRTVDCVFEQSRVVCLPSNDMSPHNGWHLGLLPDDDAWLYTERAFESCVPTNQQCYPTQDLGEVHLTPVTPPQPPIGPKADFWLHYQGNFGSIKVPGCGLHMDALFDPYLLWAWANDTRCFEAMMSAHSYRNDNRIVVDPRSGYGGHNDLDAWHRPDVFAAFLADVRSHTNANGEHFKVLVFLGADGHVEDMRADASWSHWKQDIDALAAVTQDVVDATAPCWECRHVQEFTSAKRYIDMARYVAAKWPLAVHSQHLVAESSSWSSWPCEGCAPSNDADDPNQGNELVAWHNCRKEGWCDMFLYQLGWNSSYLYPTPGNDAIERWVEIVERLGDDPWSLATSRGNRHGWPQVPVILFEFIYDAYWQTDPKATEAYGIDWCKRALAFGGWGCGSASVRR